MSWIFLAAGAQLINAVVALIDKYIVTDKNAIPHPFVYAFYTCLLSGVWIVVYFFSVLPIPFFGLAIPSFANIHSPTLEVVGLAFLAAYTFFMALVSMFNALQKADASDVVPVIGAVSALCSFGLGYYFLGTALSNNFIFGIALLALGTFLVSQYRFSGRVAMLALHAGLFFAVHYIAIKGIFLTTNFDDGFFWSRIAFMLVALSFLLVPAYYKVIAESTKQTKTSTGMLVFFNKVLAGIGTILILKATDLGDVAVVQALGGLQFVFLLMLGILFAGKIPDSCGERGCREESVVQKAIFVSIITLGFLVLFA